MKYKPRSVQTIIVPFHAAKVALFRGRERRFGTVVDGTILNTRCKGRWVEPRRGLTCIVAIVAFVVISAIAASMLRSTMQLRQWGDAEWKSVQSELLARAGGERARLRIASDRNYSGEVWEITYGELRNEPGIAPDIAKRVVATVEIRIQRGADTAPVKVLVVAKVPVGRREGVHTTKLLTLDRASIDEGALERKEPR